MWFCCSTNVKLVNRLELTEPQGCNLFILHQELQLSVQVIPSYYWPLVRLAIVPFHLFMPGVCDAGV